MDRTSLKIRYTLLGFFIASVAYGSLLVLLPELPAQVMQLRGKLPVECTDSLDNDADGFVDILDPACQVSVSNPESFQPEVGNWTNDLTQPPSVSSSGDWNPVLLPPSAVSSSSAGSAASEH
ncbi:MAG: hypothetical protein G01um101425_637 [Candidatus Peregrinibacteria bacterium Gr01-1014_25]|nr:MAG: hypothetical protein G01um101425_637 [Candidatus Peregrinibacteria bacterium Gr01-1014_25]